MGNDQDILPKILRFHGLAEYTGGVHRTTIDEWEARGEFPLRFNIGPRAVGWLRTEVEEWAERRKAMRRPPKRERRQNPSPPKPSEVCVRDPSWHLFRTLLHDGRITKDDIALMVELEMYFSTPVLPPKIEDVTSSMGLGKRRVTESAVRLVTAGYLVWDATGLRLSEAASKISLGDHLIHDGVKP